MQYSMTLKYSQIHQISNDVASPIKGEGWTGGLRVQGYIFWFITQDTDCQQDKVAPMGTIPPKIHTSLYLMNYMNVINLFLSQMDVFPPPYRLL